MKALSYAVAWLGMCVFLGWVLGMAATEGGYPPREVPLTSADRP